MQACVLHQKMENEHENSQEHRLEEAMNIWE